MLVACGPEDRLERVRELQARGRFQESLEPLRELLAARPDDAEVHYRYGAALRHSGQSGMALWSLRKASEHPDWVVSAGLELAAVAIQVQIWETAIEASGRVLAVDPENVEAWVLRAEARLSQKSDPAAALADFDRALELDPGNFGVQASRAAALLSLDRIDEAGAAIADLEDLGREAHLGKGVLGRLCVTRAIFASERRELDEAEALFSDCLERFPIHGTVLEEATDFFDERGRPEHATQILRAVLVEAPRAVDYRIALAGRLRAAGEFEEAEQVLRAGLELEDAALVADAWAALADHFVAVDDLQAAASAYERSFDLVRDPSALQVLTLADVLARAGQDERALEVARRLDNDAYRGLVEARVHLNQGRPRLALERLDEILPTWPDNPGARYYAARAAEQIGDFDRAIEEYRQSIRSRPEFTDSGLRMARLHEAEGAHDRAWVAAIHHYRAHPGDAEGAVFLVRLAGRLRHESRLGEILSALRETPLWGHAVAIRADTFADRGGPEVAVARIRRAEGIDLTRPRDAAALRSLCVHLLAAGRPGEAEAAVEAALGARPDVAAFHEIRALVQEHRGAPLEQVRASYQRAVDLDPKNAPALESLGRLAAEAGDAEAALAFYDRAAAANPHDPSPLRRAAALHAGAGRSREAEERWEALLREHPYDADAAMQLVRLRLARGAETERTLELARRATRFRGGPEARSLLARVRQEHGEGAEAARDPNAGRASGS
jgi:tetratricopeptide (TPR) repeat protein